MSNIKLKKILITTVSVVLLLIITLAVHIYMVTRPKASDAFTMAMARIDIKQPINQEDATIISSWLYQQKGIDHVLVNPTTRIAVFTFYPIRTSADIIVNNFKSSHHYKAERFIPSEEQLRGGCPVSSTSTSYVISKYFKQIF